MSVTSGGSTVFGHTWKHDVNYIWEHDVDHIEMLPSPAVLEIVGYSSLQCMTLAMLLWMRVCVDAVPIRPSTAYTVSVTRWPAADCIIPCVHSGVIQLFIIYRRLVDHPGNSGLGSLVLRIGELRF
jgi:hypothetical protein